MAIIYYPSDSSIYQRDTGQGFTEQIISATPNVVFMFSGSQANTASLILAASASVALTASYLFGSIESASYAITSSYALNGGGFGTTLNTGSTYPITSSWANQSILSNQTTYASQSDNASSSLHSNISTASLFASSSDSTTTASYSLTASLLLGTIETASYAVFTETASYVTTSIQTSSYADFAPVNFNSFRAVDGKLLIKSDASGSVSSSNWYWLSVYDTGDGYYTTQLESASIDGSQFYTGSQYSPTASYAVSASFALTSSLGQYNDTASLALTASLLLGSVESASYATTASYALNGGGSTLSTGSTYPITSSWSVTASYALNGGGSTLSTGSKYPITASWAETSSVYFSSSALNYISFVPSASITKAIVGFETTSSNEFVIAQQSASVGGLSFKTSGSQRIYLDTIGNIQLTGSVKVSGGITSSLYGTSSWATNALNFSGSITSASYASTASLLLGSVESASYAAVADTLNGSVTTADTASYVSASNIAGTVATAVSSSHAINSDTAVTANSAVAATSASYSITSSYALNGGGSSLSTGSSYPITASWAENVAGSIVSASHAGTSSYSFGNEYIHLVHPHSFSTNAIAYTASMMSSSYGHALFNGTANSSSNYVNYILSVPTNLDSSQNLRANLKFQILNNDTGSYRHILSMANISDGSSLNNQTTSNSVNLDKQITGSANTVWSTGWVTLTNWSSSLTPDNSWLIRLARAGDSASDTSISQSIDVELKIEYARK